MSKEIRSRTFKSGNSVALRLPKALGIKEGTEMRVREEQGRYVIEPVEEPKKTIDLTGIWGVLAGRKIDLGDRLMEPRELDWDLKQLNRDR